MAEHHRRARARRRRLALLVLVVACAALVIALVGFTGGTAKRPGATPTRPASSTTTIPVEAGARTGVIPHPTQGPQPNPDEEDGVHLSLISGVLDNTPIFNGDFADPAVIAVKGSIYLYASDTTTANIPVITADLARNYSGTYLGDALPTLPRWTYPGLQWGPAVWPRPDGTYVLYYSTPDMAPSASCMASAAASHVSDGLCLLAWHDETRQCISAATSSSPAGPFVDHSSGPFICPAAQGGAIDPSVFVTKAGTPYLIFKTDGDGYGLPTILYSQRLAPDGLTTAGPPHELLNSTEPWQASLIEGPSMIEVHGVYWLMYSANDWDTANYAIGLARCTTVTGPCANQSTSPWLSSSTQGNGEDQGPGGQEFVEVGGLVWMVHHGWLPGQAGTPTGQRRLYVNLIVFHHGVPTVAPGSVSAALAELILAVDDPSLRAKQPSSFVALMHDPGQPLAADPVEQVAGYARTECRALAHHQRLTALVTTMERSGLSPFASELSIGAAAYYVCPAQTAGALDQLRSALGSV